MRQSFIERMLYIVLALVFVAAGLATYFGTQAVGKLATQQEVLQQQVTSQKEVLKGMKELLANQGKTTDDINKSLSCILVFFSYPNRANYYISDLTSCTITNNVTGKTELLPLPKVSSNAPSQSTPATPKPATPGVSPSQGHSQQPATPASPSAPTKLVNNPPQKSLVQNALDVIVGGVDNVIGAITHLGR